MTKLKPHSNADGKEQPFTVYSYTIIVYLLIAAISSMFIALTGAYGYTRITTGVPIIKVPYVFLLSTALLLASSYTINLAKKAYLEDDTSFYMKSLVYTIVLSILFIFSQSVGWNQLLENNIFLTKSTTASYVYIISALHLLHVFVGLPFLILFLWKAYDVMEEPVTVFVYFSDPDKKEKLRLLGLYWHYLDILWIYLILFFFISSFI